MNETIFLFITLPLTVATAYDAKQIDLPSPQRVFCAQNTSMGGRRFWLHPVVLGCHCVFVRC